jgi:hypothetical protein
MKGQYGQRAAAALQAIFFGRGISFRQCMLHSGLILDTVGRVAMLFWTASKLGYLLVDFSMAFPIIYLCHDGSASKTSAYLSRKTTKNVNLFEVKKGIILNLHVGDVATFGLLMIILIGWAVNCRCASSRNYFAREPRPLYCFCQSSLGQFFLRRYETGSVVRHIYDSDVKGLRFLDCHERFE